MKCASTFIAGSAVLKMDTSHLSSVWRSGHRDEVPYDREEEEDDEVEEEEPEEDSEEGSEQDEDDENNELSDVDEDEESIDIEGIQMKSKQQARVRMMSFFELCCTLCKM